MPRPTNASSDARLTRVETEIESLAGSLRSLAESVKQAQAQGREDFAKLSEAIAKVKQPNMAAVIGGAALAVTVLTTLIGAGVGLLVTPMMYRIDELGSRQVEFKTRQDGGFERLNTTEAKVSGLEAGLEAERSRQVVTQAQMGEVTTKLAVLRSYVENMDEWIAQLHGEQKFQTAVLWQDVFGVAMPE